MPCADVPLFLRFSPGTMRRRPDTIAFHEGDLLPHWEVQDGRYFVTVRQAGSLPSDVVDRLRTRARQRSSHPAKTRRSLFRTMERVLDRCEGRADLTRPDVADMVIEAISFRERTGKWSMLAYVLMPNHLHLFFRLVDGRLMKTMIGFKRWTRREAADLLDRSGERFWQREWFDHWSRSALQDERIVEYIRQNPVKAGLVDDYRNWPYGSWNA